MSEDIHEKMTALVRLLEMWRDGKDKPDYLSALIEEANEYLVDNNPFDTDGDDK